MLRLKSGVYVVGRDIPAGRYDLLTDKESTINTPFDVRRENDIDSPVINWGIVGVANPKTFDCATCANVLLECGNILTINFPGEEADKYLIDMVDATPIEPFHSVAGKNCYRLAPGRYCVGNDIPAGKFTFFSVRGTDGRATLFRDDFDYILWNKLLGLDTGADSRGETIDLPAERGNYLMIANSVINLIVKD